jgi:glycogen operon protein
MQVGDEQKAIGILYAGAYAGEAEDVYVAYNFHYENFSVHS